MSDVPGRPVVRRRSSAAEVRGRVRAEAELQFNAHGYHATSWTSIFSEAGFRNGSAYHAVPGGKFELAVEIYQQLSNSLCHELSAASGKKDQSLEEFLAKQLLKCPSGK